MATFIVGLVVFGIIAGVCAYLYFDHRNRRKISKETGCSMGCAGCSHAKQCGK